TRRFKQSTVQERNAALELITPGLMAAVRSKRLVEQRLEHVVEEIPVRPIFACGEPGQKILRTVAPIVRFGNTEPAFFLKEVQEDDLAHKFFGKIDWVDVFASNFGAENLIFLNQPFQGSLDALEQLRISFKELLRHCLDIESIFDFAERRACI